MNRVLDNGILRVEVDPDRGGAVVAVTHLGLGRQVMARPPWGAPTLDGPTDGAEDEVEWLARWPGGWPVMIPNAGDASDGQGFHGEGSVARWDASEDDGAVLLRRSLVSAPARMERRLSLRGNTLHLDAILAADAPCSVIWGEHVTLGADLVAGPVRLATSAARAEASADYAPPESPLSPGAAATWPTLPGREAPVDLSRPGMGWSTLACLQELGPAPWVEVRREDEAWGVRIEWSPDPWPLAWLWIETGGDAATPWLGRGRALGVEPCTTWGPTGLAQARARGAPLLQLTTDRPCVARLALRVFRTNT